MDPFHLEITEANAQCQQEITQVSYLNLIFMISFWHSDIEYTSYVCLYVYSPITTWYLNKSHQDPIEREDPIEN